MRGAQVIAGHLRECQELFGHHYADGMYTLVLCVGVAAPIAEKSGHWFSATACELAAEDIARAIIADVGVVGGVRHRFGP